MGGGRGGAGRGKEVQKGQVRRLVCKGEKKSDGEVEERKAVGGEKIYLRRTTAISLQPLTCTLTNENTPGGSKQMSFIKLDHVIFYHTWIRGSLEADRTCPPTSSKQTIKLLQQIHF